MQKMRDYLDAMIESFIGDPPDDDFQAGYLSAALTIYEEVFDETNNLIEKGNEILKEYSACNAKK